HVSEIDDGKWRRPSRVNHLNGLTVDQFVVGAPYLMTMDDLGETALENAGVNGAMTMDGDRLIVKRRCVAGRVRAPPYVLLHRGQGNRRSRGPSPNMNRAGGCLRNIPAQIFLQQPKLGCG